MGTTALIATYAQRTRHWLVGDFLAITAALFVGGWFFYENFVVGKHETRMYLMILFSITELCVVAVSWMKKNVASSAT